jgi:hypothetical protein
MGKKKAQLIAALFFLNEENYFLSAALVAGLAVSFFAAGLAVSFFAAGLAVSFFAS